MPILGVSNFDTPSGEDTSMPTYRFLSPHRSNAR
jgi:hypothetical protein